MVRRAPLLVAGGRSRAAGGRLRVGRASGDRQQRERRRRSSRRSAARCHTLAAAGTNGQVGPNLDDAFRQAKKDGIGEETIAGIVRGPDRLPGRGPGTGAPGMPANLRHRPGRRRRRGLRGRRRGVGPDRGSCAARRRRRDERAAGDDGRRRGGRRAGRQADLRLAGCGSCHTLADAGSTGTIGPNLDDAKPTKELAVDRVTNGAGAMPSFKGQLTDAQIEPSRSTSRRRPAAASSVPLEDRLARWCAAASASRSTTTCLIGTSKRARAPLTTPRSSQFERPSGCVEMTISSGAERAHRVVHRLQRVAVADLATRVDAGATPAVPACARGAAAPPRARCLRPRPTSGAAS